MINPDQVEVAELGTGGLALLDLLEGYERLIILDAIVSGAPPGTIHQLRGAEIARTAHLGPGHEADLPATLAIGSTVMGRKMPREVTVFAVEAAELATFTERLTPEVEAAIPEVVNRVRRLLELT